MLVWLIGCNYSNPSREYFLALHMGLTLDYFLVTGVFPREQVWDYKAFIFSYWLGNGRWQGRFHRQDVNGDEVTSLFLNPFWTSLHLSRAGIWAETCNGTVSPLDYDIGSDSLKRPPDCWILTCVCAMLPRFYYQPPSCSWVANA